MKSILTIILCFIVLQGMAQKKEQPKYTQSQMDQAVLNAYNLALTKQKPRDETLVSGDRFIIYNGFETKDYIVKYVIKSGCYCYSASDDMKNLDFVPTPEKGSTYKYIGNINKKL